MARSSVGMALGPSSRQQLSVPAETAAGSNVQYRAAGQLDIQSPQSGQGIGNIVTLKICSAVAVVVGASSWTAARNLACYEGVTVPVVQSLLCCPGEVELNICTLYHEMRDAPAADVVPDAETAWACIRLLSAHSVALPVLRHVRVLRPALMIVKCTTVKAPRVLSRLEAATRSQALCCIANLACDPEALDSIILDPSTRIGVAGLLTAWDDLWCARGVRAEIAAVLGSIAKATGAEHFLRVKRIWSRLAAMYGEAVPSLTTTSMDREAGRRLADLMMSLAAQSPAALSAFQEQRVCKQVAQVLLHELADTGAPTHSAAEQGETHVNMQHLPLRPFGACCSHLLEFMRPIDYCDDSIQAVLMQLGKCMLTSSLGEWSTSRYEAAASCFRVLATSIGHSPAVKDHLAKPTYLARAWHLLTTTFPSQNALSEDAAMQSCFYSLTALVTQLLKGTHPAAEASGQPPPETLAAALWDVCFWLAKQLAIRLNDLKVDKLGSEPVLREDLERWSLHTRDACRFFRIFVSYSRCGWLPELPEGSKATVMLILAAYMLARVIYKMMCKSGDIFDMLGTEPYALTRRVMAEAVRDSMGGMIEALASFQFARTRGHETVLRAAEVDMGSLREGLKLKSVRSRLLRPAACKQLEALLQAVQNTSQAEAAAQAAAEALLREEEAAAKRSAGSLIHQPATQWPHSASHSLPSHSARLALVLQGRPSKVRRQDEALAAAAAADPAAMSLSQQAIRIGSVSVAPPKAVRQTKASASAKPTGAPTSAAEVNGTGHPAAFVKPPPKHSPAGNSGAPAIRQNLQSSEEYEEMCCPITHDLYLDPVIAEDGHTYDRAAIEEWFSMHDTSPMTNQVLASKVLIPNILMRRLIDSLGARDRVLL
ncbi:hypothetical protein WJX72_000430 [[Myrmecia] bisecta]|uniref:U-box domain-containing protein n=1 Tax=[Myrmecia] bisecta TaxID=41462 RepID=A0AAW1R4I7_9CHLO